MLSFPSVDFFLLLQVCIFYLVLRALDTVGMYLFALVLCFLNVLLLIMCLKDSICLVHVLLSFGQNVSITYAEISNLA